MSAGSKGNRLREVGAIRKRWRHRIPVALIFPDTYPVGMANLGLQTLYRMLNSHPHVVAERFFLPGRGDPPELRPWRSVESGRPLRDFPILLFSVSFELSYLNIPLFLEAAGLHPLADRRGAKGPLVLGGGVALQLNPMPVAPMMDGLLLGEFEAMDQAFSEVVEELAQEERPKDARMALLVGRVPGAASAEEGALLPVARCSGNSSPFTPAHTQVLSNRSGFPDMFMVEVARGCGRGCRFCAAGFIYRPPRPMPSEELEAVLSKAPPWATIGLVGLEFLGSSRLETLFHRLEQEGRRLSFSSLRADAVSELFAGLLVASGQRQATLAPEAGSQRLRDLINKNLTEEAVLHAAHLLAEAGIRDLKLYFMMGLPTEEMEDVEAIASLAAKVVGVLEEAGRKRGSLGRVVVSVSTFVPKPWTPFQWVPQEGKKNLQRRRNVLKKLCASLSNVVLRLDSIREARVQAVLARGGRELAQVIVESAGHGGRFLRLLNHHGLSAERYLGAWSMDVEPPWSAVGHPLREDFLKMEGSRGLEKGLNSPPCRLGGCSRCGACDHG